MAVALIQPPVCRRCGRPHTIGLCAVCQTITSPLDGIHAAAHFAPPLRQAIYRFKYGGISKLAAPFAELMLPIWRSTAHRVDLLVPVPLHPTRQKVRGYNQSELLARAIGEALGVPVDASTLIRQRNTASQTTLSPAERRANVRDAFACLHSLAGCRIALIDDVCTTGSTLEACAVAVRGQGAQAVYALTLARAGFPVDGDRPVGT